jgi:tRNA1Val (adenine37-N6)-methyltransferase
MFHFKKFSIEDNRCAHKVGTDGTLLGAWANVENAQTLLDIGTGSGLIALMLAQRTSDAARIDAVELSLSDYSQACENVRRSPWHNKIAMHQGSVQQFKTDTRYDCIVSNPPYFNKSFKPPVESRVTPRHTETLSFQELIASSKRLLSEKGKLNVILPHAEGLHFIELAIAHSLFVSRQVAFYTRAEKPMERWLLEFSVINPSFIERGDVLLYERDNAWSAGYKNLTRDFYLNA